MRRLLLSLAVAVATLVVAPAAFADGPLLVTQGGTGVATRDGAFHYVAVTIRTGGTLLEKIRVHGAQVYWWMRLYGSWGNPALGSGSVTGEGLSHDGKTLVLASTSAQRRAILHQLGIPFEVVAPSYDEHDPPEANAEELVTAHALGKARSVLGEAEGRLVLGVDTTVVLGGRIYSKPANAGEA